ncbi:uncharacterized protein LOC121733886 [Aricia agestis]|uniref:uncharacterized protein LOC121733886 n=1 Tax=Aricia agestis TaxID=91739 RepID=UPI001C201BFE|nr:uncharacterized protein LOC121733886 [Aricia agestis]
MDRTILATLLVVCVSFASAQLQTVNGRIKITIGTTSGCGDTVRFIGGLPPVYEKYKQYLDIEFVPWGRTQRTENGLVCQFSDADCWANRLQRCSLDMLKGNQDAQVSYMACEFAPPYPSFLQQSFQCASAAGLSLIDIDYCMSTTGDALEGPAEEISREPMSILNFVPFIMFNDVIDEAQHTQALQRLESLICFALADDPTTGITHCQI